MGQDSIVAEILLQSLLSKRAEGQIMRKSSTCIIIGLIILGIINHGFAQSATENLIVVDYRSLQSVEPTQIATFPLVGDEVLGYISKTVDGGMYLSMIDLVYRNHSIIRFDGASFSSRLWNSPYVSGGIEILENSLYFFSRGFNDASGTLLILTKIDLSNGSSSDIHVRFTGHIMGPSKLHAGDDGFLYVLGIDPTNHTTYLAKMDTEGFIIWTHMLGSGFYDYYRDIKVLSSGQSFILRNRGIESRDSEGEMLWNISFSFRDAYPDSFQVVNSDSIYVAYQHYDFGPPINVSILKLDESGDILWNTTLEARHPSGSIAGLGIGNMLVKGESIQCLVGVDGTFNNPHIVELSQEGEEVGMWSPIVEDGEYRLEFNERGDNVVFVRDRDSMQLIAYIFGVSPAVVVLVFGGTALAIVALVVILKRRGAGEAPL
jgi:hypothetical protein